MSRILTCYVNTACDDQELTFNALFDYYGSKGLSLSKETFKKNLSLLTTEGRYNILAQLLSDNSHLPLRVALFAGRTKADRLIAVREFGFNCLLYSLDDVLRYGDVLNLIQADERNRVVERKEVPLFDNEAFREAIINAVLHNDWVSGNEPMVSVFKDRIEILSRGALPCHQTLAGFFSGESVPVNQKLSEIFLQLRISEKTGRGVPTITRAYGREVFEFRENSIVVTIPFHWLDERLVFHEGEKPIGDAVLQTDDLTVKERRILRALKKDPVMTLEKLAKKVNMGRTSLVACVKHLKARGYVERAGSKKTGAWRVLTGGKK